MRAYVRGLTRQQARYWAQVTRRQIDEARRNRESSYFGENGHEVQEADLEFLFELEARASGKTSL